MVEILKSERKTKIRNDSKWVGEEECVRVYV